MGFLFFHHDSYIHLLYIQQEAAPKETVACTTFSSPAYLKNFNDLSVFPSRVIFQRKSVAKVSTFFHSTKTFFKFFSERFFGAVGPRHERYHPKFIVQRLSLPKAGAKVRTLSDSATHSTHFFSSFFDIRGKYAVKQGFTTETFLEGKPRRRKNSTSIYTGVRDYIIYAAQTRANF